MGKTLVVCVWLKRIKQHLMHCKSKPLRISARRSLDCSKTVNEASAYMHGIEAAAAAAAGPVVPPQTLLGC